MTKHEHPKMRRHQQRYRNLVAKKLQEERGGTYRQRVVQPKMRSKSLTKRQYEELQDE